MNRKPQSNVFFFLYSYDFLEMYLPDCGRSTHTIESYRDTLTLFKRFVTIGKGLDIRRFTFNDCTCDFVFSFLDWLKDNGSADTTRNHRLVGLKGYLNYCAYRNVAMESIASQIEAVKPYPTHKLEKPVLSDTQMSLILRHASNDRLGRRNAILLLLLYETAARVSEIVNLSVSDLHLEQPDCYVKLSGKGKKERIVPLVDKLPTILHAYVHGYPATLGTDILFYSMHGGKPARLSSRSVEAILKQYADAARVQDPTIPSKVHPHMLRRSKATYLYQHGMALEQVSTLLGHSQLETTRVYAKPSLQQLRSAIEKIVPKSDQEQPPLWQGKEDEISKRLGLR
ncbi:MAG: integrase [Bacteroidia bacterium]|nr:integrase [Bacteroidia bacterium]